MITIREASNEDTDALEKLFQLTRQKTFQSIPSEKFKIGDFKKSTEGEEVWVAEKSKIIVGFVSLWFPDNFMHNLFVHPNWQGQGIGEQLLKKAEERLSCPMELKVTIDNARVKRFYQKHGWHEIAIHEDATEPYILFRKN